MPPSEESRRSLERTSEERERARQERVLRRAGSERLAGSPAEESPPTAEESPPPPYGQSVGEPDMPASVPSPNRVAAGRRGRLERTGLGWSRARVGTVAALAAATAVVWFLVSLFQPFAGAGSGRVIVVIPKGASTSRIGSILARDGVVSSGLFFELRAFLEGKRSDLHSGRFLLRHDMSYATAIRALSAPPPALIAVKVVIPEGYTRFQISRLAGEDTLTGDYLAASSGSPLLDRAGYGAPRNIRNLEGFLFPATYELSAGDPSARLVAQQLNAFRLNFGPAEVRRAKALGVTPYGLLTVASMVEREARVARDRPLIAAVIYNRLRQGMALGIDATIYYALALGRGVSAYEHELTSSDLRLDSPYNTRLHAGLPPTPISNPGVASIEAAAHPAGVPYLYYVAAPDGCGEHRFSTTYSRFLTDAQAYAAALKRNGGHLPTCTRR